MKFQLKHYKKAASIQLKPTDDISTDPERPVHFSIAWFRGTGDLSKDKQREATAALFATLKRVVEENGNALTFTIVKACENCTYGHFDDPFEAAVLDARGSVPFCTDKNLPFDKHPELSTERPLMFHIAHSRSSDETFNALLKTAGAQLAIEVEIVEVNN
jgi:hypothetical protein